MTTIFNDIRRLDEFNKDFKKLARKYKTLDEDLSTFIAHQLKLTHKLNIDNRSVVRISNLGIQHPKIYKARKFPCKTLKGKGAASGIRIIYAYYEEEDVIEFIEIYYKGDKENEDRARILRYYSKNVTIEKSSQQASIMGNKKGRNAMARREIVSRVIDGDTFKTKSRSKSVRLANVDTPEKGNPGSAIARSALERKILGKPIFVNTVARDKYGRAVANVKAAGKSVNKAMKKYER